MKVGGLNCWNPKTSLKKFMISYATKAKIKYILTGMELIHEFSRQ